MRKGVITYELKNKRFVDRLTEIAYKLKLFKTDGYYPIYEESTGKEVAQFICIYGKSFIIPLLEKITDVKLKKGEIGKRVTIDY